MNTAAPIAQQLAALREAGAMQRDPVGWHYIEVLAARTQAQSGAAQVLLEGKLARVLDTFRDRLHTVPATPAQSTAATAAAAPPSPLAQLLQDIAPPTAATPPHPAAHALTPAAGWRAESPRVRQFRKQLSQISVQKQVRQAIAQAPQNAGPINSHMLVLRALGLMRDISPGYLNRFMAHVDTLLCLDEAGKSPSSPKKSPQTGRAKR